MVRQLIILLFFAFSISAASQINNLNEQSDSVEEDPMDIRVVGLFKDAALVKFNGKQKLYRKGANISDDIQLISATTSKATFMIQGKKVEMGLDKSGGYNYSSNRNQNYSSNQGQSQNPEQNQDSAQQESVESSGLKTAKILRNPGGMYMTLGYINGRSVKFLVDTGASQVAMNETMAQQLNIVYDYDSKKVGVSTAAGNVAAWKTTLTSVKVGEIELRFVEALVIEGIGPGEILLGMSFLNRVKMEDNGQLLKLTKEF